MSIFYSPLPERGILRISGADRHTFLQGIITQDIHKVSENRSVFAALLSPQGKLLYDFFIAQDPENAQAFLLESDAERLGGLHKRLRMYVLRSDVSIEHVSADYHSGALWGENALETFALEHAEGRTIQQGNALIFTDPRSAKMARVLLHLIYKRLHISQRRAASMKPPPLPITPIVTPAAFPTDAMMRLSVM